MFLNYAILALAWIVIFVSALASPASPYHNLQLRDNSDNLQPLRRSPVVKRAVYNANATLDKSWNDATIFNV